MKSFSMVEAALILSALNLYEQKVCYSAETAELLQSIRDKLMNNNIKSN